VVIDMFNARRVQLVLQFAEHMKRLTESFKLE